MDPFGPTLRRTRRREHPAWRVLLAVAVSLLVNLLVVWLLDASWLGLRPATERRDVALAPLTASDWEANRAVRPARPAAPAPAPLPPRPLETPQPPGQLVKVDESPTASEAKPPRDSRYVSDQDRTVAKESKARLVPEQEDKEQIPPRPTAAVVAGDGGTDQHGAKGAAGPREQVAPRAERVARAPVSSEPGAGDRGELAPPAGPRAPSPAPGEGGTASAGVPDLRLALAPSTVAKVLGRSVGDSLDEVEEGEGTFLNTRAWKYATYFNRIKESVGNAWRPQREIQRRDPDGSLYFFKDRLTVLSVTLDDKGTLKDVKVVRSSSIDFLDKVAVEAFQKAQPFSNPPPGLVNAQGEIRYVLGFEVYGSRPGLHLYRGPAPF
jgi:TonB family protein